MLPTGASPLKQLTESVYILRSFGIRSKLRLNISEPHFSRFIGARQLSISTEDEKGLRTSIRFLKEPLLDISAFRITSCEVALRYHQARHNLALLNIPDHRQDRLDPVVNKLQDTAGHGSGSVSTHTIARILASRLYSSYPLLYQCNLSFVHSLGDLIPNHRGNFIARFSFFKPPGGLGLKLTRTSIVRFNNPVSNQDAVLLFLRYSHETLPLEYLLEAEDPSLSPSLLSGEENPQRPFPYDLAIAKELSHSIPVQFGKPAFKALHNLTEIARRSAAKIAPKYHYGQIRVELGGKDPLRGSVFGAADGTMEVVPQGISPKVGHSTESTGIHRAVIAFGSNIGNRTEVIENALQEMENRGLVLQKVSPLYETEPMYVLDQGAFLNGVCEVQTLLEPMELLDTLQGIENSMGRVKLIDKGPRNIDLDILLYDKETINTERLIVPHKLMLEREFVLEPLSWISPDETLPDDHLSFRSRLLILRGEDSKGIRPSPVVYVQPHFALIKPHESTRRTHVMAILNITPDSFSDGGKHFDQDVERMIETIRRLIKAGATIIDVGGQSTRPNATPVTALDEIHRVIPIVKLIRSLPEAEGIAISVDTFHSRVAKAAIDAGADIINDISGGNLDPEMFATVAALRKTLIISHSRGTPQTMTKLTDYPQGVVAGVVEELSERVQEALAAGIRPWRIILDPGIGFAKTKDQNLTLLRNFFHLRNQEGLRDYPWLIGTSRKKFVGTITGISDAEDRLWGTAATVTASIREGVDIVRVHDVEEMSQVAKMTDAIYRVKDIPYYMSRYSGDGSSRGRNGHLETSSQHPSGGDTLGRNEQIRHGRNRRAAADDAEEKMILHTLLGNNAIATDGLNTSRRRR